MLELKAILCVDVSVFKKSIAFNYMRDTKRKLERHEENDNRQNSSIIVFLLMLLVSFAAITLCNQRLDQRTDRQKRTEELRYMFFSKHTSHTYECTISNILHFSLK